MYLFHSIIAFAILPLLDTTVQLSVIYVHTDVEATPIPSAASLIPRFLTIVLFEQFETSQTTLIAVGISDFDIWRHPVVGRICYPCLLFHQCEPFNQRHCSHCVTAADRKGEISGRHSTNDSLL